MSPLFYLSIILLSGVLCGRLVKFIKLPNVTGYIIAGLLIGPYVLNIVPKETISSFEIFADVALGFIAFTIGCEFKGSYLKRVGAMPIVIAITESLGAVIFVTGVLLLLNVTGIYAIDPRFSILLGAISAATAPAATIMIIKQYKSRGILTETLMSVVALDDAVAIICFGLAVSVVNVLSPVAGSSALLNLLQPFHEIVASGVIGVVLGFVFLLPLKFFKKGSNRTCLIVAFIFLCIGLANLINASALLACMAFGATYVNVDKDAIDIQNIVDTITPPIFVVFFVESGAELNITLLASLGVVGLVYIVMRVIGKILGAYAGAKIMKAPKEVSKYLGFTLIPQAGVAIGLSLVCQRVLPGFGADIRAVVLSATFIYEIIGPVVSKLVLQKAGNIRIEKKEKVKAQ